MDLKELTAFRTILQEGTFSRAAEKLNYAQSTITNQIQRLEKEIGVQLFKRGWDAELTTAGRIFASEIDKLIRHWNEVSDLAKALQRDEIGSLRIGGIESAMETVLPNALRLFHEQKPRIACQVVLGNTASLSQSILQDELDFAICGEPSDPSSFYFEPLYHTKIVFAADCNHPLRTRNEVSFREILEYPVIAGGPTCLYYLQLTKELARSEVVPPLLHTVNQTSAIPHFVKQTLSVGVILDSTPLIQEVETIDAELNEPFIPIGLLQPRDRYVPHASSLQLLLQIVKDEIERTGLNLKKKP
ncbi:LysR family transcriptional regulator [Cohnella cholangitidis]|uniref:LysR family transcriptional regulator n=1 Tax=Cohnella cholangitidis TaxID=2598458 RepID=A0A7G5BS59_9BACL|nr:LysR family transcriptional regulator [Cohnella cholangitidis]QMV39793.1 LysR family transcriptional regulator [Cohnella cholangitidis]